MPEIETAAAHLRGILDMLGPCERFDHHGNCQSHFVESPCRVGKAREWLESRPQTTDSRSARAFRKPNKRNKEG